MNVNTGGPVMAQPARVTSAGSVIERSEANLPPMPPKHLAAYRRMAREPHLFDGYEVGMWVAFSGENIVAAGHDHDAVIRTAEEAGEPDPLIVPMMADPILG
jgi:hypothetical protein